MATFDEEKFRASAKAAGYSDAEIDAELKTTPAPVGAAVPNTVSIANGKETTAAFEKEAQAKGEQLTKEANQEAQATLDSPPFDFKKAINSPVGYVTGAAALAVLTGGAYVAGKKLGLFDRKINKPEIDKTIDIPMDTVAKRNASPFAQQFETTYGVPLAEAEKFANGPITNSKDAAIIGGYLKNQGTTASGSFNQPNAYTQTPSPWLQLVNQAPAPTTSPADELSAWLKAAPTNQAPIVPQAPSSQFDLNQLGQSQDPLANRGFQQPPQSIGPVAPTPSVQEGVATGNTSKSVQAVVAKELDKATGTSPTIATFNRDTNGKIEYPKGMSAAAKQGAEAFAQQYPDHAKALALEGRFGILGAGSGDNNLFNSYGSDMMKRIRDEVNQGQMVGPYGNYETKVNPAIKAISPETAIGKDLAQLREAQVGGNYGPLGTPATIGGKKGGLITGPNLVPKAIKAGGPAMLLMGIADAANAATQGKYGEAAMRGVDVATDYMPMISQLKQGLSPSEAGAPGVSAKTFESAYKLGSPYAQTEEAKLARLKEKAGAGRGIAPPSAYMR